ncbi:MAG: hypothetical protein A4E34_02092 [Methanoregula sp. PtaU1.Bin006]|nr:MAG: hypothetical protein A4E33_02358 [Methanoregula sp. PtaB.Bin085]OPY32716.1 MAG: hypothetical protein A4E34_02092 [Methanoregula sp. PtaU1.Bin006]
MTAAIGTDPVHPVLFLIGKIGMISGTIFLGFMTNIQHPFSAGKATSLSFDTLFLSCIGVVIVLSSFVLCEWGLYGKPGFVLDPEMVSDLKRDSPRVIKGLIIAIGAIFSLFILVFFMLVLNVPVVQRYPLGVRLVWYFLLIMSISMAWFYYKMKQDCVFQ